MRLTRFVLIVNILLVIYCAVMVALLYPWAWAAIAIGVVVVLKTSRSSLDAFGTARWASAYDVQGLLDGNGLILGAFESTTSRLGAIKALFDSSVPAAIACEQFFTRPGSPLRPLLRLNNAVHTAVFAPTGVGKGVSCVIPFLLTCKDSCVVVDFKGENAKITTRARRKMGHKVVIIDPFKTVTPTPSQFNPLDFIDPNSPVALDECRDLAAAIVVRTGQEKDPHWVDSAEVWITAMIATVVAFAEPKHKSLQAVRDLLTDPKKMAAAIRMMCESTVWGGLLARLGHQLTHFQDKELGSTLTTTNRFLRFLDTMTVFDSTLSSSFNPADLLKGKMTVYLVLPPEHMTAQTALLRLWIGSLLRAVVRGGLNQKNKVHFVLDEAASLGRMDALNDAVDKYRAYSVRLQLYYQSLGQLKRYWPEGQDQTLLSNVTQVFFGVNDNETARYVSERLGKETIIVTSGGSGTSRQSSSQQGQGGGSSSYSSGSSTNNNWSQSGRELLQPNEVMAMSERIAITFIAGYPPIWTTLVRYYHAGFRARFRTFWPAVKKFGVAVLFLLLIGVIAAGLTGFVVEKSSQADSLPENSQFWRLDQ
jgi:type IV secretion system protein VirD4